MLCLDNVDSNTDNVTKGLKYKHHEKFIYINFILTYESERKNDSTLEKISTIKLITFI